MDKTVQTWFNSFYGSSLGASAPVMKVETAADEARIAEEYRKYFLEPMCYIATGTKELPENKAVLNRALTIIAAGPITDWMYLLEYWVATGYFVYSGDLQADFNKCIEATRNNMRVVFATANKRYKDIALHTVNRNTVDCIPVEVLYYPRDLKAHFNGRTLQDLSQKAPSRLNATEVAFLFSANARGYIDANDLAKEQISIPYALGMQEQVREVTILDDDCPPVEYIELCKSLAPAQITAHPTLFMAVKDYASMTNVSDAVKNYIAKIAGSAPTQQASSIVELNDQMVREYLQSEHGITCTNLSDLYVNTGGTVANAVELDPSILEGSARELMEALNTAGDVQADTLDNIIERFCAEEKLDKRCTIEQLLQVINYDTHPTPPTFIDEVATYIAETGASPETTLDEIIKGEKHKYVDPINQVIEFIQGNEFYPEHIKAALMHSLVEGEMVDIPDEKEAALRYLPKLGLTDDMLSRFLIAVQNDSKVELPVQETVEKVQEVPGDPGWNAAVHLLRGTRTAILKDASTEMRTLYTQVLYAFLRLLMFDPVKEREEVTEAIENRAKNSEGEVKQLLLEAVDMLRG